MIIQRPEQGEEQPRTVAVNAKFTIKSREADVTAKVPPRAVNVDLTRIFNQMNDGRTLAELVSPAGGECNHPIAVRVNAGGVITEVTSSGTRMYTGPEPGRGVRVELDFDPETDDDLWTLALHFHKGHTYVEVLQRRGDERKFGVIWRD